jgi:uncharacterized protein (TIGR02996 family)
VTVVRNPALEAAIIAQPDDPAAYQVYADWLSERGDPSGEVMSLALAGRSAEFSKAAHALIASPSAHMRIEWRHGCVRGLPNNWIMDADWLARLMALPIARFVEEILLGGSQAVPLLVGLDPAPPLRSLSLTQVEADERLMTELWSRYPRLVSVQLYHQALGDIIAPDLRRFVMAGTVTPQNIVSITTARWPLLGELSLKLGNDGRLRLADFAPLLAATGVPKLASLTLDSGPLVDELTVELTRSPLIEQLVSLTLRDGVRREGGKALATAAAAGRLQNLILSMTRSDADDEDVKVLRQFVKSLYHESTAEADEEAYACGSTGGQNSERD